MSFARVKAWQFVYSGAATFTISSNFFSIITFAAVPVTFVARDSLTVMDGVDPVTGPKCWQ